MTYTGLSDLRRGFHDQTTCVRVSHLWCYHGGLDNGPIKLLHMVLVDAKGDHGYAMVPTSFVYSYINELAEGVVYEFARFVVLPRQTILNPTGAPFMITFTQSTTVKTRFHLDDTFPRWTHRLTPLEALPAPNDTPADLFSVQNKNYSFRFIFPLIIGYHIYPICKVIIRSLDFPCTPIYYLY